MRSSMSAPVTAMCTEVGNTSFEDCDALTWSFGCTGEPRSARGERREHLVHVHVRRGAADRSGRRRSGTGRRDSPAMTSSAAAAMASAMSRVERCRARSLASAAAFLMRASATICAGSRRVARDREVLDGALRLRARRARPAGTRTSPMVSCSMRYSVSVTSSFLRRCSRVPCSGGADCGRSDRADDDVGHGAALGEAVVRADDSQRTRGDGVADQLGGVEQLGDGVAQVLAPDVARRRRRRAARRRRSPRAHAAHGRHDRRDLAPMCGGSGGASGSTAVDGGRAPRRTRRGRARR